MTKEGYSAGLVSQSFWFLELRRIVLLRQEGLSYEAIRTACVKENLFGAAKAYRAQRMAGYLVKRLKALDDALVDLFGHADLATQKLINLIAILRTDRLYFEFLYEVYREKAMLGAGVLEDLDVNAFFTQKEQHSDLVAGWEEVTKRRLRSSYLNFLTDAGLLTVIEKQRTITPAVLDDKLEQYLLANGEDALRKALTGVN